MVVHCEVENECTSYNFRLFAIFTLCQVWWKFDVVITKIILLVFLDTVYTVVHCALMTLI